jgi:hypothetical protein
MPRLLSAQADKRLPAVQRQHRTQPHTHSWVSSQRPQLGIKSDARLMTDLSER